MSAQGAALEQKLRPIIEAAQHQIEDARSECVDLQKNLATERSLRFEESAELQTLRQRLQQLSEQAEGDRKCLANLESECLVVGREEVSALRQELAEAVSAEQTERTLVAAIEHCAEADFYGNSARLSELGARLASEECRISGLEVRVRRLESELIASRSSS
eukprot:TRINITY_DN11262_c0_g1_i2.p2 TRINITY_DN11262_c0_g1~~TRINITY_DN11262_c0_g1_i2.p2  ORF type:complete len:178 (+),score=42.24 TRINITY_DN11262_c0_g1_i2:51-536(+)